MESIKKIIDEHGDLGKVFIIQALQSYAISILDANPEFMKKYMNNGDISWDEWLVITQKILDTIKKEPFPDLNKKV